MYKLTQLNLWANIIDSSLLSTPKRSVCLSSNLQCCLKCLEQPVTIYK